MNIPDLIDGFITWQSTIPCRANQETPFVDERVFQNRGVCGQAFHFLPSPSPSRTFFTLVPIFVRSKSEKCFKPAESPTETGSILLSGDRLQHRVHRRRCKERPRSH